MFRTLVLVCPSVQVGFEILLKCSVQDSSRPTTAASSSLSSVDPDVDDLYTKYKKLQAQLEFLKVQEEYIKDEQKNLKKELLHAQEEVKRIQSVPLVIGQFLEAVDQNTGIVGSTTGKKLTNSKPPYPSLKMKSFNQSAKIHNTSFSNSR